MRILLGLLSFVICGTVALSGEQAAKQPFTITISTEKPVVKVNSDVSIKVHVTNTSNHELNTSANISSLTGVDPNNLYDVRDSMGNPVQRRVYKHSELATGSAIFGSVKPGESITIVDDINRLFDMSKPGKYLVQVSRRRIPDNEKGGVVKSNKLVVTMIP